MSYHRVPEDHVGHYDVPEGCTEVLAWHCPALTSLTITEGCVQKVAVEACPALTHINGQPLNTPEQAAPYLRAIAEAALQPDALEMDVIHSDCGTAHCMAGWAGVLFPEKVKPHRELFDAIPLLGREAADMFFEDNATAREFLERYAEDAA